MKLIKSLFVAIIAAVMTTIAGSVLTTLFDEAKDAQSELNIHNILGTKVYAEETENDTPEDANHTFTTSLNTYTPSTVIDDDNNILPTPQSQSPNEKENSQETEVTEETTASDYINILANLVPISGEDMDYEKVLGISEAKIKALIEDDNLTIWQIAQDLEETELLESAYYAIYPARIIEMLDFGIITQDMTDLLIEKANEDIANHSNVSIEQMIENLPTTD